MTISNLKGVQRMLTAYSEGGFSYAQLLVEMFNYYNHGLRNICLLMTIFEA